jgi:murein DD-endopeptidase MepM/ murein hydrolase activator NlpD
MLVEGAWTGLRRPLRVVPAALTVALAATIAAADAQRAAPPPTPSVSMLVRVPPAVVMMDGKRWLIYELHLQNAGEVAATLTGLDVFGFGAPYDRLALLEGAALRRALDAPADAGQPFDVAPGGRRVVYVDLDLGDWPAPTHVRHHLRYDGPAMVGGLVEDTPGIRVDATAPAVLGAPLAGGPWAAVHHPDWERGHRRVFYTVDGVTRLPGRFTIDFVRLDGEGRTARGDRDVVANALGYGADVLAVAEATVAATRDDRLEVPRVSARVKHAQDDAAGNYVSLDLGDGRFAVYEHLKPGSVRVRPGQRVSRGDVVAQLGFTGDSTGPHLHLHVADAAPPLAGEGRPFVFDRFEVLGRYLDIASMGAARWQSDGAGQRHDERPAPNVVVEFAPAAR